MGAMVKADHTIEKAASPECGRSLANTVWPLLLVSLAACCTFFWCLGEHPLFNPDEGLYAEPAREMLDTGEYITTLLNYIVRFTKPPLVMWLMTASYHVFGINEFAARFVDAASGLLLVAATYIFANKYFSWKAALTAGLSLASAPLFVGTAREAITDMPLSLFLAGALMAFIHGFYQRKAFFCYIGAALLGLAVMTKGPVGVVLPVMILGLYHLIRGELGAAFRYYRLFAMGLIILAIALPWFAIEICITKGAYYQEFLVRENFQRFTSVVDHRGAWWYHLAAVAGGFFPWSLFVPQAVFGALRGVGDIWLRPRLRLHAAASGADESDDSKSAGVLLFCAVWFLVTLVFFSLSVSKLMPYTVPAFPALAILVGVYADTRLRQGKAPWLAIPLLILSAATGMALYMVPHALQALHDMPAGLPAILQTALLFVGGLSLFCLVILRLANARAALATFASGIFVLYAIWALPVMRIVSSEWEGPLPWFSAYAALSGQPIVVYHMRKPSIPFYAHRQVVVPVGAQQLAQVNAALPSAYLIGRVDDLPLLAKLPGARLQVKDGRFVLMHWQHRVMRPANLTLPVRIQEH